MMLRIALLLAVVAVAMWPASAAAIPLIGFAVAALGITGVAATIVTTVVAVGASIGISYIVSQFTKPAQQQQEAPQKEVGGTELDIRLDAEVPQQLIVGRAVTAGSLVYAATYGKRGEDDNSDLIEVIALADHPCYALAGCFIEGERAVLRDTETDRGAVVDGYTGPLGIPDMAIIQNVLQQFIGGGRVGMLGTGVFQELLQGDKVQQKGDLLALRFFDGTQTAADSFAVAALSGHEQPWTAAHVGKGVAYVRTHSIYNREKVPGRFRWKFIVEGIELYDPRKDTTVGGSGPHRFGTESTYEWTDNPAVIIYNIARGIYVNGEIFYGLEGTDAAQLPLDTWFAAMNECDLVVDRGDGFTEKQYTCGAEIAVDTPPMDTIKSLLKTCAGRFCDIGGVYKMYVGSPGAPVLSVTDGDLMANRDDTFKPVLGLEQRINYLTGTYTSPQNGWVPWIAPAREIDAWRAEDGRRLPADLQAPMVQSGTQMQRLMLQMLQRARRQRKHTIPLPPAALVLEPGDVIEWTSERNGYDAKLFEVDDVDVDAKLNVILNATEVDPADYDWDTDFELPEADGRLVTLLPAAKIIEGFDAEGIIYYGDLETKRPAIRITWDPPEDDDLTAVRWQIRVAADPTNITAGTTDDVAAGVVILHGGLQSLTGYQVRARFESFNGWASDWSLWITVTTPDARIVAADFDDALRHLLLEYRREADRVIRASVQKVGALLAELAAADLANKETATRDLRRAEGNVTASYREAIEVATGPDSAIARRITELSAEIVLGEERVTASYSQAIQALAQEVNGQITAVTAVTDQLSSQVGQHTAQLQTRFIVGTTPSGAIAAYELQATAEQASAGLRVVAIQDGQQRIGYVYVDADRFWVGKTGVAGFAPIFIIDTTHVPPRVVLNGDLIASGTITADKLNVASLEAITAQTGDLFVGAGQQVRILGSQSRIEVHD